MGSNSEEWAFGRRGRSRYRLLTLLAVMSVFAVVTVIPAFAVHDAGFFELDGNATNGPAVGDDWDNVCHQVLGTDCTTTNNTTGATAVSWTAEPNPSASIFTGGGSKDPQNVSSWAWKDAGGLPDKDNLLHSFAARYSGTPSAICPAGTATTCDILYFGSDRFDNSGDAQQGFWFFQNKITLGSTPSGGGFNFNGVHKNGDLLVISDFSNGGTVSTISVYQWNSAVSGNLQLLASSTAANCASVGPADSFCGLVNSQTITMPWPFTDKSGTSGNQALNGEFYEGGINLSTLGLSGECFSSAASETRSSTSTTATLKDFVLGQFGNCAATMTTQVSNAGPVAPGISVTDTATVVGNSATHTPSGTVTFFLCGPIATGACDGTTNVGNSIGTGSLSGSGATASATSPAVNTAASPLSPGRYCFRASWPGDTNYTTALVEFGGANGTNECFVVQTIPTTTVTTPSDSSGLALGSPVALGTVLFDKAVVTGTSVGGNPPGTVAFFLCDPDQVQGATGSETCATGGTALSGNPRTLVADVGSNPPTSSVLSSPGITANKAGVWCFRAVYTPTGTTYTGSSDASHTECVTVGADSTTTVTTPQVNGTPISGAVAVNTSVTDHAVVTGTAAGGTPTGTINFFICDPTVVASNGGTCSTGGVAAGSKTALAGPSAIQSHADSDAITANVVGTWCFRAEYVPDTVNYTGSSDASTGECFLVRDTSSATSAQNWLPNDSATITTAGGTNLNGTLSFTLYSGDNCGATSGSILIPAETFTLTDAASPATRSTTNTTFTVSATATVSWKVVFTSSDTLVGNSSRCEVSTVTITN